MVWCARLSAKEMESMSPWPSRIVPDCEITDENSQAQMANSQARRSYGKAGNEVGLAVVAEDEAGSGEKTERNSISQIDNSHARRIYSPGGVTVESVLIGAVEPGDYRRKKAIRLRKCLISRRLGPFFTFFTPFLALKYLDFSGFTKISVKNLFFWSSAGLLPRGSNARAQKNLNGGKEEPPRNQCGRGKSKTSGASATFSRTWPRGLAMAPRIRRLTTGNYG